MTTKLTVLWRVTIASLVVVSVPWLGHQVNSRTEINAEAMLDTAVSIHTISHVRTDAVGDSVWDAGGGSGFLVATHNCEVWTNHHVVKDAALIEVRPRGWNRSRGVSARVVNATARGDFAILEMASCEGLTSARLGDSSEVGAGDETYAVGNPLGRNPDSVSRGIISHTKRHVMGTVPYLQTDAAINPGNSGGPLFHRDGSIIGINTAIAATRGGTNVGIGYALPINAAKALARKLHDGPPSWGRAGIESVLSTLAPDEAEIFDAPDGMSAVIVNKAPANDSPAAEALQLHDVIYAIADHPVRNATHARRVISSHDAGDSLTFSLVRAGERHEVTLVLDQGWRKPTPARAEYFDGVLGMELEMWADKEDERGHFTSPVITKVYSQGPAHRAKIASSQKNFAMRRGLMYAYLLDVKTVTGIVVQGQYTPVASVAELNSVVNTAHEEGAPVLLEIAIWARQDPTDAATDLRYISTEFFRLTPALTRAAPSESLEPRELELGLDPSRPVVGAAADMVKRWRPRSA